MTDIEAYTVDKLKHFYDTYYVPNNAVLVIAGDIDIPKTKLLVQKYYGVLQAKPIAERVYPIESLQTNEIRFESTGEVQNSTLVIAYRGVQSGHPDGYALDLAANILGAGASSRLHRRLVYQMQKATSTSAFDATSADPGYFMLMASLKPGESTVQAEKVILEEVKKIQNTPVSLLELEKSKNQIMKEYVDELTTLDGKAQALAVNEIIHKDYKRLFLDLDEYQKVTTKDIQRVSKQYLISKQKVVGILNPKIKSGVK
jgi:zinc protease